MSYRVQLALVSVLVLQIFNGPLRAEGACPRGQMTCAQWCERYSGRPMDCKCITCNNAIDLCYMTMSPATYEANLNKCVHDNVKPAPTTPASQAAPGERDEH